MTYPQFPPDPMLPGAPLMAPPTQQRPSRWTAIAAGVLAVAGGVAWIGATVLMWIQLTDDFDVAALIVSFATALTAVDLLAGGVFTFLKTRAGIVLIVIGCAVVITGWVVLMAIILFFLGKEHFDFGGDDGVGYAILFFAGAALLMLVPAILTMYLALCRSTKRWMSSPAAAMVPHPYTAYGQQGW